MQGWLDRRRWLLSGTVVFTSLLFFLASLPGPAVSQPTKPANNDKQSISIPKTQSVLPPQAENQKIKTLTAVSPQGVGTLAKVQVPQLKNLSLVEARRQVTARRLYLADPLCRDSSGPGGIVIQQNPAPYSLQNPGTEVTVWISCPPQPQPGSRGGNQPGANSQGSKPPGAGSQSGNPPPIQVPDVRKQTREVAVDRIQAVGLQVRDIHEISAPGEAGLVTSQSPNPYVWVEPKTPVDLWISKPVPRVVTLNVVGGESATPGEPKTFVAHLDPPMPGVQYQFSFGDGKSSPWDLNPQTVYSYPQDGNYPASVVARWGAGKDGWAIRSDEQSVSVHEVPYKVGLAPSPQHAKAGDQISFQAEVEPAVDNATYTFDFGDKTKPQLSSSPLVFHAYSRGGDYEAKVTVLWVDPTGAAHEHRFSSRPVNIAIESSPPPPVQSASPQNGSHTTAWVLGLGAVALGGVVLWRIFRRPPPPRPVAIEIDVVVPPGTQTVQVRGRLWARIEAVRDRKN